MSKRIGFAGASGTGKTWLANRLAAELELPMCPVGSRQVAEQMGYANHPYDVDRVPGARRAFQVELLARKIEWERPRAAFVTDRTPVDNLTYTALHDVSAIDADMLERARRHFHTYTHVVVCWCSSFHRLGDDPARVADPTYHAIYEACLMGLLDELQGPHTRVVHLHLHEADARLQAVLDFVRPPTLTNR